jgi:hypothetical protein
MPVGTVAHKIGRCYFKAVHRKLDGEAFDWGDRSIVYRHPQYWAV